MSSSITLVYRTSLLFKKYKYKIATLTCIKIFLTVISTPNYTQSGPEQPAIARTFSSELRTVWHPPAAAAVMCPYMAANV